MKIIKIAIMLFNLIKVCWKVLIMIYIKQNKVKIILKEVNPFVLNKIIIMIIIIVRLKN